MKFQRMKKKAEEQVAYEKQENKEAAENENEIAEYEGAQIEIAEEKLF